MLLRAKLYRLDLPLVTFSSSRSQILNHSGLLSRPHFIESSASRKILLTIPTPSPIIFGSVLEENFSFEIEGTIRAVSKRTATSLHRLPTYADCMSTLTSSLLNSFSCSRTFSSLLAQAKYFTPSFISFTSSFQGGLRGHSLAT